MSNLFVYIAFSKLVAIFVVHILYLHAPHANHTSKLSRVWISLQFLTIWRNPDFQLKTSEQCANLHSPLILTGRCDFVASSPQELNPRRGVCCSYLPSTVLFYYYSHASGFGSSASSIGTNKLIATTVVAW